MLRYAGLEMVTIRFIIFLGSQKRLKNTAGFLSSFEDFKIGH